ncbi:MAG TPA: threonine ammonia-lyase, biosynthetic, partial [Gammaproteobacteria bacterium]|nr:threonine ammonia-lyase, biosynthetic [Gammaproteobacteria bacterium]
GANMNFDRLQHVAERTQIGERREGILAVTIPEQSGSFSKFCRALGSFNITEFNYRYADQHDANVFVGIQLKNFDDLNSVLATLKAAEYSAEDLTDNEIAKVHVRHLLGGHAGGASNERLFRFRFPERPGALLGFLDALGGRWNISLFHYRNHGTDYGRVLCGIQVSPEDHDAFENFLEALGYYYVEETDNPAYRIFLS